MRVKYFQGEISACPSCVRTIYLYSVSSALSKP